MVSEALPLLQRPRAAGGASTGDPGRGRAPRRSRESPRLCSTPKGRDVPRWVRCRPSRQLAQQRGEELLRPPPPPTGDARFRRRLRPAEQGQRPVDARGCAGRPTRAASPASPAGCPRPSGERKSRWRWLTEDRPIKSTTRCDSLPPVQDEEGGVDPRQHVLQLPRGRTRGAVAPRAGPGATTAAWGTTATAAPASPRRWRASRFSQRSSISTALGSSSGSCPAARRHWSRMNSALSGSPWSSR